MRTHTNLTIESELKKEFHATHGGSLSRFLEEKMAEYLEKMRLQWWLFCPKCGKKNHIRIILNNEGKCKFDDCGGVIAEKIKGYTP